MGAVPPILLAGLTGFISGLLMAVPVGPVNLTILNEGARRGFKCALLISLGAVVMEGIYCFIAFTGFASFFTQGWVKAVMELVSFGFLLFLGIKYLRTDAEHLAVPLGATAHKWEERLEERLHPHSAFMIGLVRVLANLGVLLLWIVLAANFIAHDWVRPDWSGKLACVAGVVAGTSGWFVVLSYGAARGHGRISSRTLQRLAHWSGIGLLLLALAHGGQLLWQLVKHPW